MKSHGLAWHFVRDGKLRDGRPLVVGEWLIHDEATDEPLALCVRGLHASIDPLDALSFAPGSQVCLVEVGGRVIYDTDKLVCTARRPLWTADATEVLVDFARECARDVMHLWTPPEVVKHFLETGEGAAAAEAAAEAAGEAAWAARAAAAAAAWAAEAAARGATAAEAAAQAAAQAARGEAVARGVTVARAAARERQNATLASMLMGLAPDGWEGHD
jgi:hypothetical protein